MAITPDLTLKSEDKPFEDTWRPSRSWRGFAVEHVALAEPYNFRWSGNTHYLAWHDILFSDGASQVDGLKRNPTRDLRNSITFLPSGCSIEGWAVPTKRPNSFTALYFDPGLLRDDLELRYQAAPLRPIQDIRNGGLQESMRKLAALVTDPLVEDLYAESACIMAAIEALALTPPETTGKLSPRQMKAVTDYIEEHFAEEVSLADLAMAAGLSRYHFGRAFKLTTGQSPYAFVLSRRVQRAGELLAAGDRSIEAVAALAGFGSTARLRRHFQQEKGMTPRSFQRTVR